MGKLSAKIAKRLKKTHSLKIVDLTEYRECKNALLKEWEQLRDAESLIKKGLNPQHAIYIAAQNMLSFLIEMLSDLNEFDRLNKIIVQVEEEYMPSWPPASPISLSYFFTWSSFDVRVGIDKESYTTCLLDLSKILNLSEDICHLFTLMASSRLGVYKVIEQTNGNVLLEELFDQRQYLCVMPNQHPFHAGELWLARLLSPIHKSLDAHVIFTSPYVLMSTEKAWQSFFERTIIGIRQTPVTEKAYSCFMRNGLSNKYWLEFIMQSYSRHTDNAIYLMGIPDDSRSRPHPYNNSILPDFIQPY